MVTLVRWTMSPNNELFKWHCRPGVARPLRYGERLLAMGPREIAARVRQRASRNTKIAVPAWELPDRQLLSEWLERRFLFGPERAQWIADAWRRHRPEQASHLVESAREGLDQWQIGRASCRERV